MNAFDVLPEMVEIPVVSGAAKSVWPIRKKLCYEDTCDENGEVGGSKW